MRTHRVRICDDRARTRGVRVPKVRSMLGEHASCGKALSRIARVLRAGHHNGFVKQCVAFMCSQIEIVSV
jgi:hypothetical protein